MESQKTTVPPDGGTAATAMPWLPATFALPASAGRYFRRWEAWPAPEDQCLRRGSLRAGCGASNGNSRDAPPASAIWAEHAVRATRAGAREAPCSGPEKHPQRPAVTEHI